jgi:hypothetical protein
VVERNDPRRWRAVAGVAVCLGLAGIVTGIIVARHERASDEHLTADALQREELRDGWKALGAAAVQDAQNNDAQAANAAAPAPSPNVVIVNVPAQSAVPAQPNVTNLTLPNGTTMGANGMPSDGSNMSTSSYGSGYVPSQSMPVGNYSPVQGYAPTQSGYAPSQGFAPPSNYSAQNSYGTTTGSAAPITPAVGNGSIPGSTPNPALPNNGLVGSTPTPGLPNGSVNGAPVPVLPSGAVPVSPGTSTLPSGFSVP